MELISTSGEIMDHTQQTKVIGYGVGGLVFLVIFGLRMRRMMQSRPFNVNRVWILPAIFIALMALTVWRQPPLDKEWLWVAGGLVIGAALGWFRAKTIRLTLHLETRQVMAQGSPLAMIFILAIFVVRFALRGVLQTESGALGISVAVADSAFLAMACGLFAARAIEMGVRATKLLNQAPRAPAV